MPWPCSASPSPAPTGQAGEDPAAGTGRGHGAGPGGAGEKDTFGRPAPAHHREVVVLAGDHSLKADVKGVSKAVEEWLARVLRPLD
ncbi:hypothetical protein GCM10029964_111010 [Kibdelosporangium lantanae]